MRLSRAFLGTGLRRLEVLFVKEGLRSKQVTRSILSRNTIVASRVVTRRIAIAGIGCSTSHLVLLR